MARPSEEFSMAWLSLSSNEAGSGWHAIALPSAGPVEVQVGRRLPDNAEAILVGFPSVRLAPTEKLPEGRGFSVEQANPDQEGLLRLALTRREAGSAELFASMACDVVGALDDAAAENASEAKLLRVFIGRVGAWQEFMRKGSQAMSPEVEVGLIGELTVLVGVIDSGVRPLVGLDAWVGPLDGLNDFEIGTGAMEVKATLSVSGFPVKISSLEQLDNGARSPLFLVGVRLRQNDAGLGLPDLVKNTRALAKEDVEAARLLDERLIAAGYFETDAKHYIRRFTLVETRVVEVTENFPRLTPGTVPNGIMRAKYELDLDRVEGDSVDLVNALKKLGAI